MRRFTLVLAAVTVGVTLFASFVLPGLLGDPQWVMSPDVWTTVESARWIWDGAMGTVYQANPWWSALPAFPAMLAPFVALGDRLGLVGGLPFTLAHPTMWLVVGPVCAAAGAWSLLGVQRLADTLGVAAARQRALLVSLATGGVVPTVVFGHPEDLVALGASCLALTAARDRRWDRAAAWLCAAVLFQTWAGLVIPVLWAMAPEGRRRRFLVLSAGFPALVGLTLLALDPAHAFVDLAGQPMANRGQHLVWWSIARRMHVVYHHQSIDVVVGSSSRSIAVAAAVVAGLVQVRRPGFRRGVALCAAVLIGRALSETEVWSYYLLPGAAVLAVVAAGADRRWRYVSGFLSAAVFVALPCLAYTGKGFPAFGWTACASVVAAVGSASAGGGKDRSGNVPARPGEKARAGAGVPTEPDSRLNREPTVPIVIPAIGR